MSAKNKLTKAVKRALASNKTQTVPAVLGDYSGNVATGRSFEVYARLVDGLVVKVINQIAPNRWDLKVTLGKSAGQRVWQVIGVRDAYSELAAPNVPEHSSQHRYLPIYRDQLIPLLLFPISDTITAQLFGSIVICNKKFVSIPSQVLDFSGHVPTNGARWVLVEYDSDGNIILLDGTEKESPATLTIDDVPLLEANCYPIGAVRVYTTQTELKYLDDFLYPFTAGQGAKLEEFNDAEGYPEDVTRGAAAYGTSEYPARRDHVHHFDTSTIKYRQFVWIVTGGDFEFVQDGDGNPVMNLEYAE